MGLVHEEVPVAALGLFAVQGEGVLALAEHVPVAAVHGSLHLALAVLHAALNGVHLAGGVAHDQRRTVVGLGLFNSLQGLVYVGAHGHLRHIHVAVAHGHLGEALLPDDLARRGGRLGATL
ncbi:hypothetical protein SDC9_63322 [bioreactor metagenome]|uniref:Uncharacterized protein n=1 Tax=bioreactor metagenome TaxID=1076179 RepID=A0A644XL77_9ZZZZ